MISPSRNKKRYIAQAVVPAGIIAATVLGQTAKAPTPPVQPLPFSHKQHLDQGLECHDCHTNPDPGERMGFSTTANCMACHQEIAADTAAIKELTKFHQRKQAVPWVRIYQNPEWVWFSHRAHLAAGAKCDRCHGPVAQRDVLWKEVPVTMESCMKCHRESNASNACNYCHEGQ